MTEKTLHEAYEAALAMRAPMNVRQAHVAATFNRLYPEAHQAHERLIERLLIGHTGARAPAVGDEMPQFVLPSDTGRLVSLDEIVATGPAVLSFNRGHWCTHCRLELRALAMAEGEILRLGARIVSIIPERQAYTSELKQVTQASFDFLSDIDNGYALSLGLAFWLGDDEIQLLGQRGRHLATYQGNTGDVIPIPATFVIGRD
jgi:peroxiredoxin